MFCSSVENVSFTSTEEDKQDYQEELLLDFTDEERSSIFKVCHLLVQFLSRNLNVWGKIKPINWTIQVQSDHFLEKDKSCEFP